MSGLGGYPPGFLETKVQQFARKERQRVRNKWKWERLRPKVDEAIRAGFTAEEFMELNDLDRKQWYAIKPKGFHWRRIQTELNVEVKRKPKSTIATTPTVIVAKPEPKPEPQQEKPKKGSKVAVVVCEASDLRGVLEGLI